MPEGPQEDLGGLQGEDTGLAHLAELAREAIEGPEAEGRQQDRGSEDRHASNIPCQNIPECKDLSRT